MNSVTLYPLHCESLLHAFLCFAAAFTSFIFRPCCLYAVHRCKDVKTAELIEIPFWEADSCGCREPCVRWGPDPPMGRGTFVGGGHVPAIVMYLCTSALRIVRLLPHAAHKGLHHRDGGTRWQCGFLSNQCQSTEGNTVKCNCI